MSFDNLESIAIEIGDLNTQIKALTERKKELEKDLRPSLADRGPIQFGNYQFECKLTAGRKTLDKQALADDGVNVDDYMKVGAPFTTMTIKMVDVE